MSIMDSIKADRKLTLNHWRYKLLHWTFGINPSCPEDSNLPPMFYTHYCPLFHLTNLITIFSPLILCVKIAIAIFMVVGGLANMFGRFCGATCKVVARNIPKRKEKAKVKAKKKSKEEVEAENADVKKRMERLMAKQKAEQEAKVQAQLRSIPTLMAKTIKNCGINCVKDFDVFWHFANTEDLSECEKSEIEKVWQTYSEKFAAAHEASLARKAKLRQQMIFWVNFSRVFIKLFLNVFYAALTVLVAYISVFYVAPLLMWVGAGLYTLLSHMAQVDWLRVISLVMYWTFNAFLLIGMFVLLYKVIRWSRTTIFVKAYDTIAPPVTAIYEAADATLSYCYKWFGGVYDFVGMFYEENCPAIEIVSEEDAAVASVEGD